MSRAARTSLSESVASSDIARCVSLSLIVGSAFVGGVGVVLVGAFTPLFWCGSLCFVEEGIVGLQSVWRDVDGVSLGVACDDGFGRLREAAREARLVHQRAHVAGAKRAGAKRVLHTGAEVVITVDGL